jgi:signal transduction histidine kinase
VTLKVALALLQAAILAAGLSLMGALVVESFERSLRSDADDLLIARADALDVAIRARARDELEVVPGVDPALIELNPFAMPGLLVEIWDREGRQVAASAGLSKVGFPRSAAMLTALARGEAHLETVPAGDGQRVRLYTRPIVEGGRTVAVVRVGESLQPIDQAVHDLLRPLIVGGAFVLLACIVATWHVVSRAFEPLESIAATAERIAETGDVSVAVEPEGTAEIRRLATTFNRMVERINRLLDSQRQLLADTSHELRNPLTVIRTDLDLLGRDLDPETRQEVAAEQEEAERMSRLVADLLYLTREEQADHGPVELVRLDRLASEVVERLAQIAPDHEVRVRHTEPVTVSGTADRLKQLIANLVENAIRYSPEGGSVIVDVRSIGAGLARLEVADDGIGIAPEHLPRVFDRFYRVDPARSRATGGTGLGLAIVKYVAESHGGMVQVVSEPGVGSTFSVTLPLAPDAPFDESSADPGGATSAYPPSTLPGRGSPTDPAAAPSGRAADSPPVARQSPTDRQAPRR